MEGEESMAEKPNGEKGPFYTQSLFWIRVAVGFILLLMAIVVKVTLF